MTAPKPPDELSLRYQEACAQDSRRPGERVRAAVHAHAAMVISAKQADSTGAVIQTSAAANQAAANQTRWKLSLLASVALLGLTGLLVLQFDRSTPEEQELVLGRPSTSTQAEPAATLPQPQAPAVRPAPDTDREIAGEVTPTPRATPAAKVKLARAESSTLASEEKSPARTAKRESPPAPRSHSPSLTNETAPAVGRLSAQLADATAAEPTSIGAVEQSSAGAGSAKSALRATKPRPAALASVASEQRLDKTEQLNQAPAKESPAITDLTLALHASARAGLVTQVERLINQGAAINAPDKAGRTPLILATLNGNTALVARLLALGANPALADHDGLTALQHAHRLGHQQIASLLGD